MAEIYRVTYDGGRPDPGFPMMMKLPRMGGGEGAENLVGFEVEHQMLQAVHGSHVPRFVAAGDMGRLPYLVMEYIEGRTLQQMLDEMSPLQRRPAAEEIARWGRAIALAAHSLHRQNAVHLDLKPANVIFRADGSCVLLDFGLSWHAHYPDLLAADMRPAIGSPAWMAPEQVVGVRGDPRSDIFAIGVMLYELATGELPFGARALRAGCASACGWTRRRRACAEPAVPPWLQEIILHCLESAAAQPAALGRAPGASTWATRSRWRSARAGCAPRAPRSARSSAAGSAPPACTTNRARCPPSASPRCPS
jgi:serine/threonine protein kinase